MNADAFAAMPADMRLDHVTRAILARKGDFPIHAHTHADVRERNIRQHHAIECFALLTRLKMVHGAPPGHKAGAIPSAPQMEECADGWNADADGEDHREGDDATGGTSGAGRPALPAGGGNRDGERAAAAGLVRNDSVDVAGVSEPGADRRVVRDIDDERDRGAEKRPVHLTGEGGFGDPLDDGKPCIVVGFRRLFLPLSARACLDAVAERHKVSARCIVGEAKTARLVRARDEFSFLLFEFGGLGYSGIARRFRQLGSLGRDHTTIRYAVMKYASQHGLAAHRPSRGGYPDPADAIAARFAESGMPDFSGYFEFAPPAKTVKAPVALALCKNVEETPARSGALHWGSVSGQLRADLIRLLAAHGHSRRQIAARLGAPSVAAVKSCCERYGIATNGKRGPRPAAAGSSAEKGA